MELLYIYIDSYKGLFENQHFNFSDEFRFEYVKEREELQVEKNQLAQPNFFRIKDRSYPESGKIINITGIIGKNGAGKTTILDFIKENLLESSEGLREKAIVVTRNEQGQFFIHQNQDLKVDNINKFIKMDMEVIYSKDLSSGYMPKEILPETTVIYYSNVFDARNERTSEIRNISTNHLVKQYKKDALGMKALSENFSETELYRLEEIRKQLNFFYGIQEEKLEIPIKLPQFALISTREIYPRPQHTRIIYQPIVNIRDRVRTILKKGIEKSDFYHDAIKLKFYMVFMDSFLMDLPIYSRVSKNTLNKLKYLEIIEDENGNYYRTLITLLKDIFKIIDDGTWYEDVIDLLTLFHEYINEDSVLHSTDNFKLQVNLTEKNQERPLKRILDLHQKLMKFKPFLDFDWGGDLSSGEKAFISFYSRLYSLIDEKQIASNMKLAKNVMILIDEGELYLHPEWQRKFIFNMISFLQMTYTDRNIQIVLTSNSPIIISDLTNSNLIFIDKSETGRRVINELRDNKQTFASNIHTLFSDAFFMSSGLIGEFASYTILSLIQRINTSSSEIIFQQRRELETLISQIGEPVLRNKLISLLKEKLIPYIENTSITSLLKTIQDMQHEIEELKRRS
ncbi:hypothetical protein CXK86_20270 [Paenibacillus sp. BGI2013]|uniref:AAA family ATPase n=1 Tax=Paenibacillus sp. BGI2013 TaxID=2058902 RepID=UPI000C6E5D04|nr:AAA family ATPase [Paenibacillus sp. BGI2013]PKQ89386.1 hypothetical protein CXK86_20270 [Paenibacillus sp. BGI2013]